MLKQNDQRATPRVSMKALDARFDRCSDFQTRAIAPGGQAMPGVWVCWLDGVAAFQPLSEDVLRPLTDPERLGDITDAGVLARRLMNGAVYAGPAKRRESVDEICADLCQGYCAVVLEGLGQAICFEVRSTAGRSVSEPTVEKTVKGGKDAFVEMLRMNTSLVRRRLRSHQLKCETLTLGQRSATTVALLYVEGIVNETLPGRVRRQLEQLDIDGLLSAGDLEQYIVDAPRSPFPQLLHTERPDRFAEDLLEGRVGILVDGLPVGFLTPATLARFLRVSEDRSQHFLVASALTLLRWMSMALTLLLPAGFVAVAMYHQEMIPFRLMTSMIDAKQQVPFSVATEILSMLVAFELLQEAGLRLPDPIGDTVSIIGALIVGQSAVEARVVSPVAVIVVATAGICGFTLPSRDLGSALRLWRLGLVLLAIILGMYGVMLGLALFIWQLCTLECFGVSYTAPMSEGGLRQAISVLLQPPLWREKFRPAALRPRDKRRQK